MGRAGVFPGATPRCVARGSYGHPLDRGRASCSEKSARARAGCLSGDAVAGRFPLARVMADGMTKETR